MELNNIHHNSTAKTAPDLIRRTCVQGARRKPAQVRRHCQRCQASSQRNQLPEGTLTPQPVPPWPFLSVCTDIFSHAKARDHQGDWKDYIVLISCRHSSFILGWPAHKKGLTKQAVSCEYADCMLSIFDITIETNSNNGPQ